MWILLCFVIFALTVLYLWGTAHYDYYKKKGIPYHRPIPILGSFSDLVFRRNSFLDSINNLYEMTDGRVFGIFDQRKPMLLIRDPELIKQITIKDFDHFVNHRPAFKDMEEDNLFGYSMFALEDAKWKDMRSTLSPFFTGRKMRQMFELINKAAQEACDYLKKKSLADGVDIDCKDYFSKFTNDVIASTAFGLQVNSLLNENNIFYQMGKRLTTFTLWQNIKFLLFMTLKPIMKFFKVSLFDKQSSDYFKNLVLESMRERQANNIHRPDMINMLMEATGMITSEHTSSHNRKWSESEIVAQCFLFFFAGFETSSVVMCFTTHELMENPEIQQRLWEEIRQTNDLLDGKPLTYEALQDMKYMDMVMSEVLRKWPVALATDRLCSKDYEYTYEDGEKITVSAGEAVFMPMCAIQRDAKFYENPLMFDPARFSDENKNNIQSTTYFPFGLGPRNCIGSRFALLEIKAMIYYLLKDFRFCAAPKTTVPMKLSPKIFQLVPPNGFWLKFIPRAVDMEEL